jgi:glycosyltransferase involved in cell wall biosynthesis
MKDLISIVIPVYNVSQYLDKCLDSVIKQTYENIEIICVENNSTDDSAAKLMQLAKKDDRIITAHSPIQGLSATRNVGIKLSTGKYLSFLDSDDIIDKDYILELYNSIIKNNSDVAICNVSLLDNQTNIIDYEKDPYFNMKEIYNHKIYTECLDISLILHSKFPMIPVMAWGKLFKTNTLKDNNINFVEGLYFEDQMFTHELIFNIKYVSFVNKFLYIYRVNRVDSIIYDRGTNVNKINQALEVSLIELKIIDKYNANDAYYKFLRGKIEYLKHWISWHPVALDHPLYQENQKRIEEIYNFEKEYLSKSWRFKYDVYKKRLSKYLKKFSKIIFAILPIKYYKTETHKVISIGIRISLKRRKKNKK